MLGATQRAVFYARGRIFPGAKVQVVYEKSGDTMAVNRVVVDED
jgi:hypothetical protein